MTDTEEEPILCEACRALNQHETARCPYAQHRVHGRVAELRARAAHPETYLPLTDEEFPWLLNEMDRWAARWVAARDATIAAQYRAAEAIEIRLIEDDNGGCANCAHFLDRINTCMGPKLQQARQLDAGVYVPPWCPGFHAKSDDG